MKYLSNRSNLNQIVFERESSNTTSVILIVFGILITLIFLGLSDWYDEFPFWLITIFELSFGLVFVVAGIYLPIYNRGISPERVIFDHTQKLLVIEMADEKGSRTSMSYSDIESFDIFEEKKSPSAANSRGINYIHYHVVMKRKNGGEWFLTEYTQRDKATKVLKLLREQIELNQDDKAKVVYPLPRNINMEETPEVVTISWENPLPFLFLLGFLGVGTLLIGALLKVLLLYAIVPLFGLAMVGLVLILLIIFTRAIVKKIIYDFTTRYLLSINSQYVEYKEISRTNKSVKESKTIKINDANVVYSYAPGKTNTQTKLRIGSDSDSSKSKAGVNDRVTISFPALNPAECHQLEQWLRKIIQEKVEL